MKYKELTSVITAVAMFFLSIPAFAHTSSQANILEKEYISDYGGYYIGGEGVGWSIDESCHAYNSVIQYHFTTGMSNAWKTKVHNAATLWGSTVSIQETTSSGGTVRVSSFDSDIAASFYDANPDSNGHITVSGTSWKIKLNSNYSGTVTKEIIAHEFGHVIGLNDLFAYSNRNKLMYYLDDPDNSNAATAPTTQDKRGAEVITGSHTSHTWAYRFYRQNSSGQNQHERYCSYCKGIKKSSIENCSYSGSVFCTKCGIPQGYSPSGIELPDAILPPDTYAEQRRSLTLLL